MAQSSNKTNLTLFRGRFRTNSLRMPGRDYAGAGIYFVTICTKHRSPWFGEIRNNIMGLNKIGCVIAEEIQRTPQIRTNIILDRWVIMPNHIHIIIQIVPDAMNIVETSRRDVSTWVAILIPLPRLRPQSLGAIINHLKSSATKRIRELGYPAFAWQARYYDRIIRNEEALYAARHYIVMNPSHWPYDRNFQERNGSPNI